MQDDFFSLGLWRWFYIEHWKNTMLTMFLYNTSMMKSLTDKTSFELSD